ncbi:L-idonate 5-dehydrogenase [Falsiroseomonas oryziterrae]|uniref:L-idonate 5-dehydrogenase n=1 Tax=Falsiroseomonas oryziterrae TaxID=2911368 RepID=UPI001F2480DC|nr:L-idonate 5-dehydrogenase [Roseomonas sp. NPKOSM-4]
MTAVVIHAAHDLRVEDRAAPDPGIGEVRIRIGRGGICGSDLHYFHAGGFGTVRVREPMVLGHEAAGVVEAVGAGVTHVAAGDAVAVNPSLPCGACAQCLAGRPIHCTEMRFLGSAMRMPHVQGAFRARFTCEAARAVKLPVGLTVERAAFAEPLSVCLHAAAEAGPLLGARVLVTGSGPIGVLCAAVARLGGAREVVVTDLVAPPLAIAEAMGADRTHALGEAPEALAGYAAGKGHFDVAFECSGSGAALVGALPAIRPGGVVVQVGVGGEAALPLSALVAREVTLRGSFRFHAEFGHAVEVLASGRLDPTPMLTEVVPAAEALRAFELASDRRRAMKVQLAF